MKFRRFIFIFCLVSIVDCEDHEKLSKKKNDERLATCGEAIDISKNQVISFATDGTKHFTATFISPRHILTSAELVLGYDYHWRGTNTILEESFCDHIDYTSRLDVPQEAYAGLKFGFNVPNGNVEIEKAYVFCNELMRVFFAPKYRSYPMILVIKTNYKVQWPCLHSAEQTLSQGSSLNLYEYQPGYKNVSTDLLMVYGASKSLILTNYSTSRRYGDGALFTSNSPYALVGMCRIDNDHSMNFFDVRSISSKLCYFFNLCPSEGPLPTTTIQPKTGKLSEDENKKKQDACGMNIKAFGYATNGKIHSTATLISPRHILTSADIVLKESSAELLSGRCASAKNDHVRIDEILPDGVHLMWNLGNLEDFKTETPVDPAKAYIICNKDTAKYAKESFYPMIVEISPSINVVTPCLADRVFVYPYQNGSTNFGVYSYSPSKQIVDQKSVKFKNYPVRDGLYISTTHFENYEQRGAALFEQVNGIEKMVAIGSGGFNEIATFFDIQWILEDLCELAGICQPLAPLPPSPPPTEASTTEAPSVTPEPVNTEKSTTGSPVPPGTDNSTISNTHEPSILDESTPPEPEPMEPIRTIDVDREFEEFKEREEKEVDSDDEWDNDFYMSADFFRSSGKRIELFVGFLMVTWRVVLGQ